jgi:hypothetical protein
MKTNRKIALLLVIAVLAALLCACASGGIEGEWKNPESGSASCLQKANSDAVHPLFGTSWRTRLPTRSTDQLTIGFVNTDGTESNETVVINDGEFTYMGLDFVYQN